MKINALLAALLAGTLLIGSCTEPEPLPGPDPGTEEPNNPGEFVDPEDPEEPSCKGIKNAADLKAFADSVNQGGRLEPFTVLGKVVLLQDIDMDGVGDWEPIGKPSSVDNANTSASYTGSAFTGYFDGCGPIYNFRQTVTVPANGTYGLFGVLDGATVENLVLGRSEDKSTFTVLAAGTADAGILAGTAVNGATIRNCTNRIPLIVGGTSSESSRFASGCFVGYACSSDKAVTLEKLTNEAPVQMTYGSNTTNGAAGVMVGGIAGFCTGAGSAQTVIESCENKGDITGECGRSSGIAATLNAKTFMRYCVNRGNQTNHFTNGRIANLTCIMGTGSAMDDCTNYGKVVTSDPATTTAGMVALLNADNVVVSGGGNYGEIVSANALYHGLLVANFSKFASVSGCYAGGSCSTWTSTGQYEAHPLSADTWISHIGVYSSANFAKITDIGSPWGNGGGSGVVSGSVPEFKNASLKILFIGNSFTKDAVEHLPGLISAAGISDVTIAHCYYGGRTIPEYNNGWATSQDYTLYYMNAGDSKWSTYSSKVTLKDVAESGRWDVVSIQEHTGNSAAWSWTSTEKSAVQGLLDKCAATQTAAPKNCYIMSQVYYNMDKIGSGSRPYITWSSQAGMYDVVVAQARKVLDETSVDDILATGTMLQNLRTSGLDNEMNLTRDGYHMDYGIARYGAACLIFEKLITPKFGKNLDGNTYRYANASEVDGSYSTPVTDANATIAVKAARYAIEKPFEVTDMKGEGGSTGGGDDDNPGSDISLSGSGTESDPYQVGTAGQMKGISSRLVEGETRYFVLTADIDMSSITDWTPVNTANKAFGLDFDGGNHSISGFTCTNKNYASLFGLVHGSVRNLRIVAPVVSHTSQCGIVATWLGNNNGSLSATISNVRITDALINCTAGGAACVGMIAANAGSSHILDCSATGSINLVCNGSSSVWTYVGGIVGRNYVSGDIRRCSFSGSISNSGKNCYGFAGITGGSSANVPVAVRDCWSAGSITGGAYNGGIVAEMCKGSTVENCYSTMNIRSVYNLGGIVARISNATNPNTSGTFNTDIDCTVSGCIAWGESITGTNIASETPASHYSSGAVVGFSTYLNTLSNCYRIPALAFSVYSIEAYNTLSDTPDCSPSAPLVHGPETYYCSYNGKAAAAGATVSSVARTIGWDESVWNLDESLPKLR